MVAPLQTWCSGKDGWFGAGTVHGYTITRSCVRVDGVCSDWFEVLAGVCQGCVIAPEPVSGSSRLDYAMHTQ